MIQRLLGVSILLLAAAAACRLEPGPRQLPTPRFDPVAPFRLSGRAAADVAPNDEDAAASFEERMRRRLAPTGGAADDTVILRTVPLPGDLVADLPPSSEGWRWGREGDQALGVHVPSGGPADALILTSRIDAVDGRSLDANRFRLAVAPALASSWLELGSPLVGEATTLSGALHLPSHEVLEGLEMLLTPTLGRGLGFTTSAGSFSGWRWIGANRSGTFVRLGSARGSWASQGELPDAVVRLLGALPLGGSDSVASFWQTPPATASESAALLVIGTASRDGADGVHLAALCRLQPACPVSNDLARWLDTLRPPEALSRGPSATTDRDLTALAFDAGLLLYTGDRGLTAADLQSAAAAVAADGGEPATAETMPDADPQADPDESTSREAP